MNARRFSLEPTTSLSVRKLVSWLAIPAILGILGGCAYYPYGYYQSGYTSSVYAAPGEYTYFDLQPGYAQYYSPPLYAQYMLSPAGRMAPPMVGVMAPRKGVEIGVSNRVKIGRFLPLSQPAFWAPLAGAGEHDNFPLRG